MINKNFIGKVLIFSVLAISPILMSGKVEASQRSVENGYETKNQEADFRFGDRKEPTINLRELRAKMKMKMKELSDQDLSLDKFNGYTYTLKYRRNGGELISMNPHEIYDGGSGVEICVVVQGPDGSDLEEMVVQSGHSGSFACVKTVLKEGVEGFEDVKRSYGRYRQVLDESNSTSQAVVAMRSPTGSVDVDPVKKARHRLDSCLCWRHGLEVRGLVNRGYALSCRYREHGMDSFEIVKVRDRKG